MPSVFVVPVYVEVPGGFETLEETKKALLRAEPEDYANARADTATVPELAESNKA